MGATSCGWTERGCVTFPGYRGSQGACYVSEARSYPGSSWGWRPAWGRADRPHAASALRSPIGARVSWWVPAMARGLLEGRLVDSCLPAHLLASARFPLLCFRHVRRTSQVRDIGERFKLASLLIKMRASIHFCWMCVSWLKWSCWVS